MSNLHLVTGHAGKTHVTSADFGSFWAALFGDGTYVLDKGSKFAASKVSDNLVKIADGDLLMQGRHIRIPDNEYAELTIPTGTQGYKRKDLIVARYTKDADSGVEEADLVVLIGEPKAADPVDPAYVTGDIIKDGALQNDVPLYRVHIDGVAITGIDALFTVTLIPYNGILEEFAGIKEMLTAGTNAKIKTGSYTGTGTCGSEATAVSLSFGFVPKLVFVFANEYDTASTRHSAAAVFNCMRLTSAYKQYGYNIINSDGSFYKDNLLAKLNGTTLTWYTSLGSSSGGLTNALNSTKVGGYSYIALG